MTRPELYDQIGAGYDADTVLNVGAGAGSYEPADRTVVAVEPSPAMIRQRGRGSPPVVQASATHLPFRDGAFAASLVVLTVHHWPDRSTSATDSSPLKTD